LWHTKLRKIKLPLTYHSKKNWLPGDEEFAIGAVSITNSYLHPVNSRNIPEDYVHSEIINKQKGSMERTVNYVVIKKPYNLNGKTCVIVDDGIATGATMIMAIEVVKKGKTKKNSL